MSEQHISTCHSVWSDLAGVAFSQGYLDAGGIRTRYIASGDPTKPLVLALHGVGGYAEAYSRNFGPHGAHFWFVAIDMLGHGWTDKPAIDYQVSDYAGHVLAVLKALSENPEVPLEHQVYRIRAVERLGWDGPAVMAWSEACSEARVLIKTLS